MKKQYHPGKGYTNCIKCHQKIKSCKTHLHKCPLKVNVYSKLKNLMAQFELKLYPGSYQGMNKHSLHDLFWIAYFITFPAIIAEAFNNKINSLHVYALATMIFCVIHPTLSYYKQKKQANEEYPNEASNPQFDTS